MLWNILSNEQSKADNFEVSKTIDEKYHQKPVVTSK